MDSKKPTIKSSALRLFELSRNVILIAMALYLIYLFVLTIFVVSGPSMEPNFQDKNLLLINRASYWFNKPKRSDVVIFYFPGETKLKYIKRIIALPGETIELKNNGFYINGARLAEPYIPATYKTNVLVANQTQWTLKEDQYFVVGDNRENSNDSRVWGVLPKSEIIGKAYFRLLPTGGFGKIE